jgi:hypothetical protein
VRVIWRRVVWAGVKIRCVASCGDGGRDGALLGLCTDTYHTRTRVTTELSAIFPIFQLFNLTSSQQPTTTKYEYYLQLQQWCVTLPQLEM